MTMPLPATMDLWFLLASLPTLAICGYLALLAFMARRTPPPDGVRSIAFDIVVPAHNEEYGIGDTVRNLLEMDYPPDCFRVVVVADNCTDGTSMLARDAGAHVLERHDPTRRGKGYALAHAFDWTLADGWADAVVVVDADSIVSPNMLAAFSSRLGWGAECLQAEYGVRNPDLSWRTRLMTVAFALYHTLRSLGRERLGLSCGLRGNGMAFSTSLLRRVPHRAVSVVEDVEYGIQLGLRGVRVAFVAEAQVLGDMPGTDGASRTQRERWEGGRQALIRAHALPLLRTAFRRRSMVAADLLTDLLIPPLTSIVAIVGLGTTVALVAVATGTASVTATVGWIVSLAGLGTYIVRGVVVAGLGWGAVRDLMWAPVYAAWKLTLRVQPRRSKEWVRTRRLNEDRG